MFGFQSRVLGLVMCLSLWSCGDVGSLGNINVPESDFDSNRQELTENEALLNANQFFYDTEPGLDGNEFQLQGPINRSQSAKYLSDAKKLIDSSTKLLRAFYMKYLDATVISNDNESIKIGENHPIMERTLEKIVANQRFSSRIEDYQKQNRFSGR